VNILTDQQVRAGKRIAFAAGFANAFAACLLGAAWVKYRTEAPAGVPAIVAQTASQTVARIPTQHAGVRVDCTVTIDQAKNVWSITC
jgi:hypothetical protein